jgi:hypothetical protein
MAAEVWQTPPAVYVVAAPMSMRWGHSPHESHGTFPNGDHHRGHQHPDDLPENHFTSTSTSTSITTVDLGHVFFYRS